METTSTKQDSNIEAYANQLAQRLETLSPTDQSKAIDSLSQSLTRETPEVVAAVQARVLEICQENRGAVQTSMAG